MRIGLLGGTFNPIHNGHLHIAEEVLVCCQLDQIWFVPACTPPHKDLVGEVSFTERLAMVRAAIAGNERFSVCDVEGRRGGTSYSVETLRQLRREFPQHEFFFIMGLDSFREIASWKEYLQLFELAHIIVAARPGFDGTLQELLPVAIADSFCYDSGSKKLTSDKGFSVVLVPHTDRDISSTEIRSKMMAHQDVSRLVPATVANYMQAHSLYQK